jgi:hypothetical protein
MPSPEHIAIPGIGAQIGRSAGTPMGPALVAALRGTKKKEFERAAEFERSKQPIKGTDKLRKNERIKRPDGIRLGKS